jgi:hypothetical protein
MEENINTFMPLPQLLQNNLTNLTPPSGGAVASSDYIPNFLMQSQEATQWCWAAVSSSTSRFFNSASPWTQCQIVNKQLVRTDCCSNKTSGNCNRPNRLDLGLTITGNYNGSRSGGLTLIDLKPTIKNRRPIHIHLSSGVGHFVAITGYATTSSGKTLYRVQDSANGTSDVSFEDLQGGRYDGHGPMDWYFFTKP